MHSLNNLKRIIWHTAHADESLGRKTMLTISSLVQKLEKTFKKTIICSKNDSVDVKYLKTVFRKMYMETNSWSSVQM